jgi:hypothetical protein
VRVQGQEGGQLVWKSTLSSSFSSGVRDRQTQEEHRDGVKAIPLDSPRWLAVPLARDLPSGYKREVERLFSEFSFFFPFHPFATSQTSSPNKQAVLQTRLHFYTSLDTYSCSCLTFVQHTITLPFTFTHTHTSLPPTSRCRLTLLHHSSWRTNKITIRLPSPSPFPTKCNTLNITFLKPTATPFLLLKLLSLSRPALEFRHMAILHTPQPPAVTQEV